MKAGAKSSAFNPVLVAESHGRLHAERADRDAGGNRELLVDAHQSGGPAHPRRIDFGVGHGVDRGELPTNEKIRQTTRMIMIQPTAAVGRREQRAGGEKSLTHDRIDPP